MSEIPTVTEQEILERVGAQSMQRGQSYFRGGAIYDARRQGRTLKARCEGSRAEAYRVKVEFNDEGIADADCSCPVGGGGYCKHVAALLLTWRARPDDFVPVEELDAALERRSKPELVALVKQMLRQQPELETLLETPLPVRGKRQMPVNPETYRRQARAAFRHAGDEWGAESGVADELLAITEIGDGFAEQGDFAAATAVYSAVSGEVLEHYGEFQDEDGDLSSVVQECVRGLGECLENTPEDAETRAAILKSLFEVYRFDIGYGGIGMSDEAAPMLVEQTTPEERRTVAGWVREALDQTGEAFSEWKRGAYGGFLLELEADTLDDETFLRICRETGRHRDLIDRLLSLGRRDDAVAEAKQVSDYMLIGLADLFAEHGEGETGERLMWERSRQTQDSRVLEWLKQRCVARNDTAEALKLADRIFQMRPELERYREVRRFARELGQWDRVRADLLSFLNEQAHSEVLLIQIHLDEGEIDRALEGLRAASDPIRTYVHSMRLEVAEAAEGTRPKEAMEIYQQEAERRIAARGRGNYQDACQLLAKVRDLYERLGANEEWQRYIASLRAQNQSLRALKEELASAGL